MDQFVSGKDELNLAEFPLAAISDRFLDGKKTIVIEDRVWDESKRQHLPRQLTISGSDRYGLPTAKDDDVLLACIQLSSLDNFRTPEVLFTRYELLKLLRWPDDGKSYRRVMTALRRWKGLTIYSNRSFYDKTHQSWVHRDFAVFDNVRLYEREGDRDSPKARSSFVWNEVIYQSFQAGYLKGLDWDLYCRLKSPVAKRLFRFLDKRFYHSDRITLDLHQLAYRKIRVSENYNTSQIKRALSKGIRELEVLWDLLPLAPEERFVQRRHGQWEVRFEKRRTPKQPIHSARSDKPVDGNHLGLVNRGVSRSMATTLVRKYCSERIQSSIDLFDWYNAQGQTKQPGFLVQAIRSNEPYVPPKGFQSRTEKEQRHKQAKVVQKRRERVREDKESVSRQEEQLEEQAFTAFWKTLTIAQQSAFEAKAVTQTDFTKRAGYLRAQQEKTPVFQTYRNLILREHFEAKKSGIGKRSTLRKE